MSGSTDGKLTDDDLAGLAQWHDKLARDAIKNCEAEETDEATDIWAGLCSSHEEEARNHRHTADAMTELARLRPLAEAWAEGAMSEPKTNPNNMKGKRTMAKAAKAHPVIITTEFRGVFFGYATDTSGDTIKLTNARNCIYWPATNGGFMGLAKLGPVSGSRIGETVVSIELRKVTSVVEVSPEAEAAWKAAPVYRG